MKSRFEKFKKDFKKGYRDTRLDSHGRSKLAVRIAGGIMEEDILGLVAKHKDNFTKAIERFLGRTE